MKQVKLIIVGAGDRGSVYASYAEQYPEQARVVAVADPREAYRERLADKHGVDAANRFSDWREMVDQGIEADAVIIATPDAGHRDPALAFIQKGYNVLLEKPLAPTEQECREIVEAATDRGVIFAVSHVLRYTDYTMKLKEIIDSGVIGEVVTLQHIEPVGYEHYSHSYIRGNWRNEKESSFMLLAKSCHDLDWIRHIMDCRCEQVSSFGSLYYFNEPNKPAGSAERCLDCAIEADCPYSAKKHYLEAVRRGETQWPVSVVTSDTTEAGVLEALRTGPYGRCVWACDNDVVDNQVVNMEFEGGKTASFTLTAFAEKGHRRSNICGTMGEIRGNGSKIEVYTFKERMWTTYDVHSGGSGTLEGHGGGDRNIMKAFVSALANNDPSEILSGPLETLETHLMTFAAEKARRTNTVVKVDLEGRKWN